MNLLRTSLIYLLFFVIVGNIFSQLSYGEINNKQLNEWDNFKAKYGENWKVSWNNVTGTPSIIYGSIYDLNQGEVTNKDDAERLAKEFIISNKEFLKVDDISNLKLLKAEKGNEEWYVKYQQYYKGVPVYNGRISITISDKGEIKSLGSDFYSIVDINTEPKLSKNDAIKIAKKETLYSTEIEEINLIIFPKEVNNILEYNLTWEVSLMSENPLWGKKFFVDAEDGKIIYQTDLIISTGNNSERGWRSYFSSNIIKIVLAVIILTIFILLIKKRFLK